jgi:hypothetical protein
MPALLPAGFEGDSREPVLWVCSDCDEVFNLPRDGPVPSRYQILNREFIRHCKTTHRRHEPIIGLEVPPG